MASGIGSGGARQKQWPAPICRPQCSVVASIRDSSAHLPPDSRTTPLKLGPIRARAHYTLWGAADPVYWCLSPLLWPSGNIRETIGAIK